MSTRSTAVATNRSRTAAKVFAGTIPVIPFHTKLPGQTHVETLPRAADAGQRASLVLLSSPDIGGYAFEVVLVRRTGRWLVDYWNAAPPSAGLAGAS